MKSRPSWESRNRVQVVVRDSYSDLIPFQLRDPAPAYARPVSMPYRDPGRHEEGELNV